MAQTHRSRQLTAAKTNEPTLGPLKLLAGRWKNTPNLSGRGWNMIALPFAPKIPNSLNYRLLVNQYNEELTFTSIDGPVPNRGIAQNPNDNIALTADQLLFALDYEQTIHQIAADDFPHSGLAGVSGLPIHHEPGFWLHITNEKTDGLNLARLATIPHGNSVLAMGKHQTILGAPNIPAENGLPIGVSHDLNIEYLKPYKHFHENLFEGLFDPVHPHLLLEKANQDVEIIKTTELMVDTTFGTGGIHNIPFIKKQADAADMRSKFWIQELAQTDSKGNPKLRLQYLQTVFLDFFERRDGQGLIRWPHVSINTLEKVEDTPPSNFLVNFFRNVGLLST